MPIITLPNTNDFISFIYRAMNDVVLPESIITVEPSSIILTASLAIASFSFLFSWIVWVISLMKWWFSGRTAPHGPLTEVLFLQGIKIGSNSYPGYTEIIGQFVDLNFSFFKAYPEDRLSYLTAPSALSRSSCSLV